MTLTRETRRKKELVAEAGASLLEIASQARHADLRVTQKYLHASRGSARGAIDLLERKRAAG